MSSLSDGKSGHTKVCPQCGEPRPVSEFFWKNKTKGTYQTLCKRHHKERNHSNYIANRDKYIAKVLEYRQEHPDVPAKAQKRYKATHREELREKSRIAESDPRKRAVRAKYRAEHKAERDAYQAQYRATHTVHISKSGRRYYVANKDFIAARTRAARKADPQRFKEYSKRSKAKNPEAVRTATQKRRDSLRGRGGKITAAELRAMFARYDWRCVRCGQQKPLAFDHIDPNGPGNLENGQPFCTPCNSWKLAKIDDKLDFRPNSPYDTRPDLPIGTVDISMGDLPVPEWVHHPRRKIAAEQTEKLCLGPKHSPDGEMLPIDQFRLRSKKSGKPFRVSYCGICTVEIQRLARQAKKGQ